MGTKTNSNLLRFGLIKSRPSLFFNNYSQNLQTDQKIRKIILKFFNQYDFLIDNIIIKKNNTFVNNIFINKNFINITLIKNTKFNLNNKQNLLLSGFFSNCLLFKLNFELKELFEINVNFSENPSSASLIHELKTLIKQGTSIKTLINFLVNRLSTINNVHGFMLRCSGRLNGADKRLITKFKFGKLRLQTIYSKIVYNQKGILTKDGIFGVKLWICLE